ncbi:MAG: hypothetical protein GF344_17850 [Chitinivibrionales bacterium]|nr:hypothetical protein [Chitinivibrionales bacterium]MBD3358529.1 hypothetical protein [Chitinivibrionales bacterium]
MKRLRRMVGICAFLGVGLVLNCGISDPNAPQARITENNEYENDALGIRFSLPTEWDRELGATRFDNVVEANLITLWREDSVTNSTIVVEIQKDIEGADDNINCTHLSEQLEQDIQNDTLTNLENFSVRYGDDKLIQGTSQRACYHEFTAVRTEATRLDTTKIPLSGKQLFWYDSATRFTIIFTFSDLEAGYITGVAAFDQLTNSITFYDD